MRNSTQQPGCGQDTGLMGGFITRQALGVAEVATLCSEQRWGCQELAKLFAGTAVTFCHYCLAQVKAVSNDVRCGRQGTVVIHYFD
jgi:hypothetical protein